MPKPLLQIIYPKQQFKNNKKNTKKKTSNLTKKTTSANYHHQIQHKYINQATLNIHQHIK